jgi:hypothetical protein
MFFSRYAVFRLFGQFQDSCQTVEKTLKNSVKALDGRNLAG